MALRLLTGALSVASLGCGGATAGLVGLLSDSNRGAGNPTNTAPVVTDVSLSGTRTSPAQIDFTVIDADSDAVDVDILFALGPGADPQSVALTPEDLPLTGLATSAQGTRHTRHWDFARQLGAEFKEGIGLTVRIVNPSAPGGEPPSTAILEAVVVGNDPPHVLAATEPSPGAEVSGIAAVAFSVADSSEDVIDIRVEFEVLDDGEGWRLARPAGIPATASTPDFAVRDVLARREEDAGTSVVFFWDTRFSSTDANRNQLASADVEVRLRFTLREQEASPEEVSVISPPTASFRVDNNAPPIAFVNGANLIANPDARHGIPIGLGVLDAERDAVDFVFQWRRSLQNFSDPALALPADPATLRTLLTDPLARREKQICTELPLVFEGRVGFTGDLDPRRVRLEGLAGGGGHVLWNEVVGSSLFILRASEAPRRLGGRRGNPRSLRAGSILRQPAGVVAGPDVGSAWVLDRGSSSGWRLREISGAESPMTRDLASGPGNPDALAAGADGRSVLVAARTPHTLRLTRVIVSGESARSEVVLEVAAPGLSAVNPVRGVAALGEHAAVITYAHTLARLDFAEYPGRIVPLFTDLTFPWGVARDPWRENGVFVAERGGSDPTSRFEGRVLRVGLDDRNRLPIPTPLCAESGLPFGLPRPEALAVDLERAQLLVVTVPVEGGPRELRRLDLGREVGKNVATLGVGFEGAIGAVATGPDGLRLVALTDENDLAVGGGVTQRRTIVAYEPRTQTATVDEPFSPPLAPGERFRLLDRLGAVRGSAAGVPARFVWDSRDVRGGGQVAVRVIPLDDDVGAGEELGSTKRVRVPLDVPPQVIGGTGPTAGASDVFFGDLDGDGLDDLVTANATGHSLAVFYQRQTGVWGRSGISSEADVILAAADAQALDAADFDRDGRLDLAAANFMGNTVMVYLQPTSGFSPDQTPTITFASVVQAGETSDVVAADLDSDGAPDLVSANTGGGGEVHVLAVYRQPPDGFEENQRPALLLGSVATTNDPTSVKVADLDGDGRPDVVSANDSDAGTGFTSTITVFYQTESWFPPLSDAGPIAIPAADLTLATAGSGFRAVAIADIGGDGFLDILASNHDSERLVIFHRRPEAGFVAAPDTTLDLGPFQRSRDLAVGDLDGDGRLDLVSANTNASVDDAIGVFFQPPEGFPEGARPDLILRHPSMADPQALAMSDVNGDGALDLASANPLGNNVTLFLAARPGSLGRAGSRSTPDEVLGDSQTTDEPAAVAAADLDGDGDLDLVSANRISDDLTIFRQDGARSFAEEPMSVGGGAINGPVSLFPADLDGDGLLDLVSANVASDDITVFLGNPGGFSPLPDLRLGSEDTTENPQMVIAADLDGDGVLDVASANLGSLVPGDEIFARLTIFLQPPRGWFATGPPARRIEVPDVTLGSALLTAGAMGIAAADLDGDGLTDVVSANEGRDGLAVFYQPIGGFSAGKVATVFLGNSGVSHEAHRVLVVDVNGDGQLDLVSANKGTLSENVTLFLQPDDGFHAAANLAVTLRLGRSLDLNGDGRAELELLSPQSVAAGDLSGNGRLDIVAATTRLVDDGSGARDVDRLVVYFQPGAGYREAQPPDLTLGDETETPGPRAVGIADVDGDGEVDIFSAGAEPGGGSLTRDSIRIFYGGL